jgi:pyrroloquinoline quinone biosynthesis protein B
MTDALRARLAGAECVMFDGTLFTDDEMIRLGAGPKTGRRMGHMPMTGPGSTLEAFATIPVARRIFVHVNNTNPALLSDSPERAHLAAAGWEVAEDGMEVRL